MTTIPDPKKYSIEQIRAAKERTVMKTAVRPAARPAPAPRSRVRPILLTFLGSLLAVGAVYAAAWRFYGQAAAQAQRDYELGAFPGAPAASTLPSDRDFARLLELFEPPSKLEWLEVQATAAVKRTGDTHTKALLSRNPKFVEAFRSAFPADSGSLAEVYKNGSPLLGGDYDLDRVRQMLLCAAAMAHVQIDAGSAAAGEELMLGLVRAGQMVARGTAGRASLHAFLAGSDGATAARLLLLSHAYSGSLPLGQRALLAKRLRATVALEPDFRRTLIAERDRAEAILEQARKQAGIGWSLWSDAGPGVSSSLREAYSAALDAAVQSPRLALPAFREAADSLAKGHPLTRPAALPLTAYPQVLHHRSVAVGAVAGASLLDQLATDRTLPDTLEKYAASLPADPVSDKPFCYENLGESFRLWGVGPDAKDDGGDEKKDIVLLGSPK